MRLGTRDRVTARQGEAAVTAVTVADGSEEGGSDSGGQGMGSRVRLAAAAVQGRAQWRTGGGGSGYGRW